MSFDSEVDVVVAGVGGAGHTGVALRMAEALGLKPEAKKTLLRDNAVRVHKRKG